MALPDIVLDSLDTVEESEQSFFEETDGKYKFNYSKYAEAQKAALVKKNADLVKRVNANKAIVDKFKDVPDDEWTAYQEWKASKEDGDGDHEDGDGKKTLDQKAVNKMIRDAIKKYEAETVAPKLTAKDAEIEAERKQFNEYRFTQDLTALALEADVIPQRLKAFKNALVAEGIFGFHEGKVVVMDEDGEPTKDSPAERLQKLANDDAWKYFFAAREPGGGSGANNGKGKGAGSKTIRRADFEKLSQRERDSRMSQGYQITD